MKNTQKRMLGFLGLSSVAAMTVVAASMPTPGVLATASPSATDTITVRVVGNTPDADIISPVDGTAVTNPNQKLIVNYENLKSITVKLEYIDGDGHSTGKQIFYNADGLNLEAGTINENLPLGASGMGYGTYIITVVGTDENDAELPLDEISVVFSPIKAEGEQNEDDGLIDVRITDYEDDVVSVDIYLDGEKIATIPKGDLDKTNKISMGDRDSGTYSFELRANYADGSVVVVPDAFEVDYDSTFVPHSDVPDTGRFFQGLNISKEDYLVTGLIIFFVFGIVAFGIVTRNNRKNPNKKKH